MRCFPVPGIVIVLIAAFTRVAFAAAPAPYNWTGFYVGVNAGWSWGRAEATGSVLGPSMIAFALTDTTHPNGGIAGVQLGYNWRSQSNWIIGLEADIQGSKETGSNTFGDMTNVYSANRFFLDTANARFFHDDTLNWFGTVRGRLGYAVWPRAMIYATGGLAYGGVSTSFGATEALGFCHAVISFKKPLYECFPLTTSSSDSGSAINPGWTVGGGLATAMPNSPVTWKVEYLYVDLGTAHYTLNGPDSSVITLSSKFVDNVVRVGFDYHY